MRICEELLAKYYGNTSDKIPRSLSSTTHATNPNELINLDYLYCGETGGDEKYVLVAKDDLSGYC